MPPDMTKDSKRRRSAVPASRAARLLRFGLLSGELALSAAAATARQFTTGKRLDLASAVLTPGNAAMLARRLATLRGPAMKVGQMLSLQSDEILPAEFRNALSMLRSQGYAMPDSQLRRVLGREYGRGWESRFARFDLEPSAAASIGQIHRARTHGGRELALKVQFPGVARSVDSDVNNLASLLRRLDFLPVTVDVEAIATEAKRQLHLETDYDGEARNLERYAKLVADMPAVVVPRVHRALTTRRVLAMEWMDGDPLETLSSEAVPQATRNAVARTLHELMFRELFEFRFMQTDPNIANYLYLPATQQIGLLDLGSVGEFTREFAEQYRRICRAVVAGDAEGIRAGAVAIGYAHPDDSAERVRGVVEIIRLVCEPLAHRGPYDFAGSGMIGRARDLGLAVAMRQGLRSPPPQTMFLHRKLLGNFLICSRLRARVNVHALVERHL
jgi:predicted unusual protein kinase regulating ubiquinone biosynthesis (AarF/ABC1/UbiB family)